jgi:DNA polymerase I-like protein with 3'-5' exonuclease and polymerase domains
MSLIVNTNLITSMSQLPESLEGQGAIGIDLETRDPDLKTRGPGPHRGSNVCGISIATESGFNAYLPIAHECGPNLERLKVLPWLQAQMLLTVPKVGARLIYDIGFMIAEGVSFTGPFYDVQVAEPLLDENKFVFSLESISKQYLGEGKSGDRMDAWLIEKFGKKNPRGSIWRAPADIVAEYALPDSTQPLRIFRIQEVELKKQGLWDLFLLESRLTEMLARMHLRGVRVDLKATEKLKAQYRREQTKLLATVKRQTGIEPNVWAAKSLAQVFDHIGLKYPLTPKTRAPSFTAPWLESIDHPIGEQIRRIRWLDKMCGTFLDGCILNGHHEGRVHTQFNQLKSDEGGTVTGRFSSKQPNLQFIPTRTEESKKIRKAFLPEEGQVWYKLDYSQIEYRLIVHDAYCADLKGAAEVVQRYQDEPDVDFHDVVSEMVFGEARTKEEARSNRMFAKTINFGLAYGEGVDKLSRQLGLPRPEAEALLNLYHQKAPFIKPLAQAFMGMASSVGEVRTLMNRKRRFNMWAKDVRDPDTGERKTLILPHRFPGSKRAFTHKSLNARIQGSAADIMKKAMVDAWESGVTRVLGVPQLTVHDELDGSAPRSMVGAAAVKELQRIMENVVKLSVPLQVDSETGNDWGETSKVSLDVVLSEGHGGGFGHGM